MKLSLLWNITTHQKMMYCTLSVVFLFMVGSQGDHNNPTPYCNNSSLSCSQQLNLNSEDACVIHSSSVCRLKKSEDPRFKIYKFDGSRPPKLLIKASESPFEVSVEPYTFQNKQEGIQYTGINITLKTLEEGITGFYLSVQQQHLNLPYNSCRIFDFSKAAKLIPLGNISLFYDCYVTLDHQENHIYDLIVRAVPMQEEMHYIMKVAGGAKDPFDYCSWHLLIMINALALHSNTVEFKFSQIPTNFKVETYLVYLKKDGQFTHQLNVTATPDGGMVGDSITDLPTGSHTFFVVPYKDGVACQLSDYNEMLFEIVEADGFSNYQYWIFSIIIMGSLILIVILAIITFKLRQSKCLPQGPVPVKPKVLLLYSYDCELHMEVVLKFAQYLQTYCNIEVLLDEFYMKDNESVLIWLSKLPDITCYVIIMSRGVYHKVEMKNVPPMEEGDKWGDRFTPTYNTMLMKLANQKISENENDSCDVTKVFFEYTSHRYIPKSLQKLGSNYELISQLNNFLCKIHHEQFRSFPIKIYPKMPGSDLLSNAMGRELNDSIKAMIEFQKDNSHWFNKVISPTATSDNLKDASLEDKGATVLSSDSVKYTNGNRKSSSGSSSSRKVVLSAEPELECRELLSDEDIV